MMIQTKALELIDSYKISHVHMYPPKTDYVYSNFTARTNKHTNVLDKNQEFTVFVGLQITLHMLKHIWDETFFKQPKEEVINDYRRRVTGIVGPGVDVSHMERLHDLGYLPIEVHALPEGSIVPLKVPYFTVHNTVPGFGWLTNYLEDFFSAESWKMINNATMAYELRSIVEKYFDEQGLDKSLVKFMCHDFSFRGMSGIHDGVKTSIAHLTSFAGSDSVAGVTVVEDFYNADVEKELISASVPATEHSVMCAGLEDGELETFRRLFKIYPTGILSVVSDTWDFFRVITEYAEILKPEILTRDGKLVYRPDSGNPVDIICGVDIQNVEAESFDDWKEYVAEILHDTFCEELDCENPHSYEKGMFKFKDEVYEVTYTPDLNRHDKTYYYVDNWGSAVSKCEFQRIELTSEQKGAVQCLWEVFGGTTNELGYRTLDSHVGLIYGDSINADIMNQILERLERNGFAANNVVFGIGSYSYNMSSRDTWGMAMKATHAEVDGIGRNLQKDPKTGDGMKKSATGLINVYEEDGKFVAYDNQTDLDISSMLKPVFENGNILCNYTFSYIRSKLWPDF